MSASDEKISNTVVNEDDDDEDEDQNDVVSSIGKNQRTKPRFGVLQRQFSKAKSKFRRIKSKRVLLPSSSLSENANSNTGSGKNKSMNNRTYDYDDDRRSGGCKLCFLRPKVLESFDGSSTTSDPNNPNFTHPMLRVLIENNDFYSKDCNPHLDC
ncbi:hypothetical protein TanjilG_23276 [Lupinus angustifolius]|uniref:Uncharacterized protein n=1 Tax=Lupinus angustifolius TaxID=3871 RepID=A0A1J7GUQ9_LUPAN|nr:hypothetical protein TanjilG_23276 [Lupinus angustifolius]